MLMSTIVNKQTFNTVQYCAALAICLGLVLYAAADWTLAPSFRPFGLVLVLLSVVADSVLPNAQEKLFKEGASRSEVTFYTNVLVLGVMTVSTLMSGDLVSTLRFALENTHCASYLVLYTGVSYAAITTHMNSISKVRMTSAKDWCEERALVANTLLYASFGVVRRSYDRPPRHRPQGHDHNAELHHLPQAVFLVLRHGLLPRAGRADV